MAINSRIHAGVTASFEVIHVPERGSVEIDAAVWGKLSHSSAFWSVVDQGVVTAERLRNGRAKLRGESYVGRACVAENLVLELREKVPGSLAALLRFASGVDFRVHSVGSPTSELGQLIALLVAYFVEAVRRYTALGRQFEYRKQEMRGSLIGGRIDLVKSIQLRARGLRHVAAFNKHVVSFAVPVNRTVLAALREVERINRLVRLPSDVIAQVRSMAMLFDDCRNADVLFSPRLGAARKAEQLAATATEPNVRDMLALAAVILSHESFEHDSMLQNVAPRSWFVNLSNLFERAVRTQMRVQLELSADVVSGKSAPLPIFEPARKVFTANPDLVVRRRNGASPSVGDVKYKDWTSPKSSDLYQLLVHASAFGAKQAFLVFPAEAFSIRRLGEAVTGAHVHIFGLEIGNLDQQIARMLLDLGLV